MHIEKGETTTSDVADLLVRFASCSPAAGWNQGTSRTMFPSYQPASLANKAFDAS
jgi:hypothetical protein